MNTTISIREIRPEELATLGRLLVDVYSRLDGFPTREEQPQYYAMLANIGQFTQNPGTKVLVALSDSGKVVGGVVYFADMRQYGSGGTATHEKNASGLRLLGVDPESRGLGVGKKLTRACIDLAKANGHAQVVLHTTKSMQPAWKMYEGMGFNRSADLDFVQGELAVFGFRLDL